MTLLIDYLFNHIASALLTAIVATPFQWKDTEW